MKLGWILGLAILAGAVGCDDNGMPAPDGGADMSVGDLGPTGDLALPPATAARGEYLVKFLLVCGDCHTTPDASGQPSTDPTAFLAGGRVFPVPDVDGGIGMVTAKNLTPDPTTGLGNWSLSQISDAITVGVDDQGNPLFPIMPYYQFGNLTADDAMSIALYLKSLPPQVHAVPESTVTVPQAAPRIPDAQVPTTNLASSDPKYVSALRGRYLAEVACLECHTVHEPPGGSSVLDLTRAFAGGETFPLAPGFTTISANLTPDNATGLGTWTADQIVQTLKTDREKGVGAQLCPPMPGGPGRLGELSGGDLTDLATYLHSLSPIANGPFGCTDAGVPFGLPDGG